MTEISRGPRAYLILALIAGLAALAGVFTLPPLDRDESRFAQATAQMLETGNFVEINFLDEERNKKPVGIHWLQAASVAALSSAEAREIWAYRLPSVLGAILAALACFWGGQRLVGREAAFAGAALLGVTVMLGIEGGIAKTDAVLAGATTLALAALAHLRAGCGRRSSLLFWFALGLGVLIKGPVTPMVAGLTGLTLVIWERDWRWAKPLLFWPGPLLALAMVLPWVVSIQIATDGNFLREALGGDMGAKIITAQERHGGWPGYYLAMLPLTFFPAILFFVPGLTRLVPALRGRIDTDAARAARFLFAWALPTWIVFELMPTKLPHYVLPTYPALALVAGWGFVELAKTARWSRWTGRALFGLSGLIAAIVAPLVFMLYGAPGADGPAPLTSAGVLAVTAVFAGLAGATLTASRLRPGLIALSLAVLSGLGWHVMVRGAALPGAEAVRLAERVRAVRDMSGEIAGVSPGEIVTASSYTEPSLVFSLGTDTHLGTAEDVLAFAESRDDPTLVVLDLSRDDALRATFEGESVADSAWPEYDLFERLRALGDCHRTWIPGTNYSRGGDTTLVAIFTRCHSEAPQIPELDTGHSHHSTLRDGAPETVHFHVDEQSAQSRPNIDIPTVEVTAADKDNPDDPQDRNR